MSEETLEHIGVIRRSGRYPWGSGQNPHQHNKKFLHYVEDLRKKGLTEKEIADGLGMTTTQLRAEKAIAKNEERKAQAARALQLQERGMSNVAIGQAMGINESSVRALLNPAAAARRDVLAVTADMLRDEVDGKSMIDIGAGVESHLGIARTKLNTAIAMLEAEGYVVHNIQVDQLGTGKKTTVKVLAKPGTTYRDIVMDPDNVQNLSMVQPVGKYTEDGGRSWLGIEPPTQVSSGRVAVRYAEDGGADADGVIYVRPGVKDLSMGNARYAQVRIAVDGTHYLKGMAMYKDDLPEGVDLMFNTNKSNTGNKLDAMKALKSDPDSPFGSIVRQLPYTEGGKRKLSAMNIVNDESDWNDWSRNLASQMLSKQPTSLAKQQLAMKFDKKQREFDEIMSLTNPVVKKKLLESFADSADSSSIHLKAAALPRQKTHVILPINTLKDNEIYAPNYRDGERVVLIRYPHGGKFEIPELTVNNRHAPAKKALGNALAAVGINSKVAQRLSGADFDGDTVIVIPNNKRLIKTESALSGLKNFDPQRDYPGYSGMKVMSPRAKQREMGDISNLITDMTIRGATNSEIARAVRHSMVVIDAEKHKLNYKQSAVDNRISELKTKYQEGPRSGASTLISRAKGDARVNERKLRSAKDGGPVDPATGKKVWVETGAGYTDSKGRFVPRKTRVTKMETVDDARKLSSGTPMENIYADHANRLKAMANRARKAALETKPLSYSPSAKKAYDTEVRTLNAKLNVALKNKPLERKAQLVANAIVDAKRKANPHMDSAEVKKLKGMALQEARARVGASKTQVRITQKEWDAIQAGAISGNKLRQILDNADVDQVKKLATPRQATVMTSAATARAKAMLAAGYTQAEIADALGIPTSTLSTGLAREGS